MDNMRFANLAQRVIRNDVMSMKILRQLNGDVRLLWILLVRLTLVLFQDADKATATVLMQNLLRHQARSCMRENRGGAGDRGGENGCSRRV